MNDEQTSKPKIRFTEYSEVWKLHKLGEIFSERSERSAEGELISVTINSGVVKASELDRKDNSSSDKSNYKIVKKGDIAYNSMRMWQGASGFSPYNGILSPAYTVISPKENVNSLFMSYMFKKYDMIQLFKRNSQGLTSDTWNLKFPALSTIKVKIPSVDEQGEIVNLLKKIDDTINLHQEKLDLLKYTKQVYLQNMFPISGEDRPKIRFAGFTDAWKPHKLGEMFENLESGVSVNSSNDNTGYFILKTSAIKFGEVDLTEVKAIIKNELRRAKTPILKNSIIISRMNTPELVGASGLTTESKDNIFLPDRLWQGEVNKNFSAEWLIQSINTTFNIKKIHDLATGTSGSMKNISKKSMLNFDLSAPTLKEQQKIGSFFKQLGDTITLQQRELDSLKEMKKSLLKKMFV